MTNEQPPYGTDPDADDSESRAALAPFAATLRSAAVWAPPPDGLEALVAEKVRAAVTEHPDAVPRSDNGVPRAIGRRGSFAKRLLPAVAAAAVAFSVGFAIANREDDHTNALADV